MENSLPMCVAHRPRHPGEQAHALTRIFSQGRPDRAQTPAGREFHAEKGNAFLGLAHLVDREDVRVIEAGRRLRFPPKTGQSLGRFRLVTQDAFHRHDPAGVLLPRAIDHTHPAAPDFFEDFVLAEMPFLVGNRSFPKDSGEVFRQRLIVFVQAFPQETTQANAALNARGRAACRASRRVPEGVRIRDPAERFHR